MSEKKVATAYYSTAVTHREMNGIFMATFGIPGLPPMWVNDNDGKPKNFTSEDAAVLAGFKVMVSKLNRARNPDQTFHVKGTGVTRVFRAPEPANNGPTVESVFGRKK